MEKFDHAYPMPVSRKFNLGLGQTNSTSQVQQIKAVTVVPNPTQGVPQHVQNVRVSRSKSGTQRTIVVSFTTNPTDPYYQGAQVLLQQGNGNPVVVASGAVSPLTFTTSSTTAASKVIVQAVGRWGGAPIHSSPARAVSLV